MASITELSHQFILNHIELSYSLNKVVYDDNGDLIDLIIIDVNKKFEEMTNTKKDDIIGSFSSESLPDMNLSMLKYFRGLKPNDDPVVIKYHSKLTKTRLKVTGYSPKEGYLAFLHSDITEEIKNKFRKNLKSERFRIFADETQDVILALNPDLSIEFANSQARAFFELNNLMTLDKTFLKQKIDKNSFELIKSFSDNILYSRETNIDPNIKKSIDAEMRSNVNTLKIQFVISTFFSDENEFLGLLLTGKGHGQFDHIEKSLSKQLQNAFEAVILINEEGKIIDLNESLEKLTGYDKDDVLGRNIIEFMPIGNVETNPIQFKLLKSREGFVSERDLITKDGNTIHIEISSKPYQAGLSLAFIRDITKKKTLYESLKKHDKILQALADISEIFLTDTTKESFVKAFNIIGNASATDRICVYKNKYIKDEKSFELYMNWVNSELIQVADVKPFKGDEYSNGFERWNDLFSQKRYIAQNITDLNDREKEVMEMQNVIGFSMFPIFVHNEFWGFIAFGDCKTFRNWNDYEIQALETVSAIISAAIEKDIDAKMMIQSQTALQIVLDNVDAAIFVTDMETYEILFANKFTKEMFGEIEGKFCWKTVQADFDKPCDFCNIKDLLDENNNPKGVIKHIHKNTVNGRWFQNSDIAIRWVNGRMARLEVAYDISEEKKKEEELKDLITALKIANKLADDNALKIDRLNKKLAKSEAELKSLNQSKDKFFSIIAHDLKNPFQGFLGLTKELTENFEIFNESELKEMNNSLFDSANNIYKLLENLLHWSRIQRGMIKINPEFVSVMNLTELNINLLTVNADKKSITLENNCKPKDIVFADINSLNTILRNLISNAIKFTPKGGNITIGSQGIADNKLQVFVKDTGVGIPKEKLFNLFKLDKVESTKGTSSEEGSGLGLILCKDLLDLNNGDITVESVVSKGTKFIIELPINNQ